MDKPIINPAWIYGIDVLDGFDTLFWVIAGVASIALIIGVIYYIVWRCNEYDYEYEDDVVNNKSYKSMLIKGLIVFLLSSLIVIAIPTKDTMYTMLVTSYITQENLELGTSAVEDAVDYIIEKVNDLQGNNENSEDTVEE